MTELKPYQLVQTYTEARHSRVNSWLFSVLAATTAIGGIGTFISDLPIRYPLSLGLWTSSLILANRGSHASKQANLYSRRVLALEQASEDALVYDLMKSVQPSLPSITLQATPETTFYNWADAVDEGVGFIIAGNSGSGKSSVATWLAGLLTQAEPAQCLVLDPHYNDIWSQQGLTAIGHITQIEATIKALLSELDARCDRKGHNQPLGEPLLIIADEIGACLERFKDAKWIQSALKRLGSEGRKFNMTLIAINQSQNVDDIGISGALRNNYVLILLGAAARKQAQQMGKDYAELLKGIAYPCVVSGAAEDAIALHPTHGQYPLFKKKGNPPMNLIPIRQLPLTFLNMDTPAISPGDAPTLEQFSSDLRTADQRRSLENLLNLEPETMPEMEQLSLEVERKISFNIDDLLDELKPIVRYSIKQEGWVKAIDCKRNIRALKSVSTEVIREYFVILVNQGCGRIRGDGDTCQYSAYDE